MPLQQQDSTKRNFSLYYFLTFLGLGSLYPLLAVYLDEVVGLTGSQIGTILSISPVVMIVIQPFWGILSDWTQKPRLLLTISILLTSLTGLIYAQVDTFAILMIMAIILAAVQSGMTPLSDSLALNYVQKVKGNYGSIRLWGALGFALAVIVAGWIADYIGLSVIFYLFSGTLFLSFLFSWKLPEENQAMKANLFSGMSTLVKRPRYILFLCTTFLVFGPIFANNSYFGLFIKDIGGTLTGVGIAFLFAAGSEAPFMQFANRFIEKIGMLQVLTLAAGVSMVRWFFYFFEPSLYLVYATTIAQGFSVGLAIPAALQYVRDVSPKEVQVTAVSIYAAVGSGLGAWFSTYFGGLILQYHSIQQVYLFFGVLTTLGISTLLIVMRLDFVKRRTALQVKTE
ncbi:PPP family 3-phenylpropionic acid transporter [Bacillus mesophilus]|uniref:MFS transporter n=1 Tax=Bacillus mesophilus TaxID=1808955 RepID=A0A6M0Q6K3_9BACI|nr:PPP family 3-phenylpropionic acid transporter [Bacillus mesophilus]NEY71972.1 MFS transporter [Bacillus mesophilus]